MVTNKLTPIPLTQQGPNMTWANSFGSLATLQIRKALRISRVLHALP